MHSTTEDDLATLRGIYGTEEFGDERRWRNSSRNIAENFFEFLRPKYGMHLDQPLDFARVIDPSALVFHSTGYYRE